MRPLIGRYPNSARCSTTAGQGARAPRRPEYRDPVVVGDQLLERDPIVRDPIVLDRIKAFGLVDCLEAKRVPGRLTGCRTCDTRSRNSPRACPPVRDCPSQVS